jgi:hypothetical protein
MCVSVFAASSGDSLEVVSFCLRQISVVSPRLPGSRPPPRTLRGGGAAGSGAESATASPSGLPQGANSSVLPVIPSDGSEDHSGGARGGTEVSPESPSLTAGENRSAASSALRQLDSFVTGGESETSAGDWRDAMESAAGSVGGESANGVVRVFLRTSGAQRAQVLRSCCQQLQLQIARRQEGERETASRPLGK